jgi:hypothetical protein
MVHGSDGGSRTKARAKMGLFAEHVQLFGVGFMCSGAHVLVVGITNVRASIIPGASFDMKKSLVRCRRHCLLSAVLLQCSCSSRSLAHLAVPCEVSRTPFCSVQIIL